MVPKLSITNGQPTILIGLLPVIVITMLLDLIHDWRR